MSFRKIFNRFSPQEFSVNYELTEMCVMEVGESLGDFSVAQNLIKISIFESNCQIKILSSLVKAHTSSDTLNTKS